MFYGAILANLRDRVETLETTLVHERRQRYEVEARLDRLIEHLGLIERAAPHFEKLTDAEKQVPF